MPQWVQFLVQLVLSMYPQPWMAQASFIAIGAWVAWLIGKQQVLSELTKNALLICVAILTCVLVLEVPSAKARLLSENVAIWMRYVNEFDNYLGSTADDTNNSRILDPQVPLKRRFNLDEEVIFRFGAGNLSEGTPLQHVHMQIVFHDRDLHVRADSPWQVQSPNERLSFEYQRPINKVPFNTTNIYVKFPRPGLYHMLNIIDADGIYVERPINLLLYAD